jgi:hypothetical protein
MRPGDPLISRPVAPLIVGRITFGPARESDPCHVARLARALARALR